MKGLEEPQQERSDALEFSVAPYIASFVGALIVKRFSEDPDANTIRFSMRSKYYKWHFLYILIIC